MHEQAVAGVGDFVGEEVEELAGDAAVVEAFFFVEGDEEPFSIKTGVGKILDIDCYISSDNVEVRHWVTF